MPGGVDLGAVNTWLGLLVVVLGVVLSGLAYQGYRRNDSQAMLLLAVGILFLAVAPAFFQEVVAFYIIREELTPFIWVNILSRLSETVGLGLILYSIYIQRRR